MDVNCFHRYNARTFPSHRIPALNNIFISIVLISVGIAAFTGNMAAVSHGAFDGARSAVNIAISLIGYMALFLGLMKVAEEGGLLRLLARSIRPIMVRLFPEVPSDHPAMGAMIMNIAANMMGLGNAATPLGIKAMKELDTLNTQKGTATNAMCLFLAINTSGLALLPTGAVAIRALNGSADPWGIMASTMLATSCATVVGILAAKFFQRLPMFRLRPVDTPTKALAESDTQEDAPKEGLAEELVALEKNTTTTRGVWILRVFLLCAMSLLVIPPVASMVVHDDIKAAPEAGVDEVVLVYESITIAEGTQWRVETAPEGSVQLDSTIEKQWRPDTAGAYTLTQQCPASQADCIPFTKVYTAQFSRSEQFRYLAKNIGDWVIPVLIVSLLLFGFFSNVKVYETFVEGAKEGFSTAVLIIPYLVAILVAVGMFRASGAEVALTWIGQYTGLIGLPGDVLPMAVVRPLSGQGAFGLMTELLQTHGPDSYIGYLSSTLLGSTDTTFYVLAVYFGAVGVSKARHAALAGISADIAGIIAATVCCYWMFGHLI